MIRFEWDEQKNKANRKKHSIWFEEAQQVFDDPEAIRYFPDPQIGASQTPPFSKIPKKFDFPILAHVA